MAQENIITPRLLGAGLLESDVGTLYIVPTTGRARSTKNRELLGPVIRTRIKTIVLVNKHTTSNISMNLYVNNGSGKRHIIPVNLQLFPGFMLVHDDELILGPGDTILGSAGSEEYIDYTIHGIEEFVE